MSVAKRVVRPENAIAFDPAEFIFTSQAASEMARSPGLFNRPPDYGIGISSADGKVTECSLTDIPENRFFLAVRQRYNRDRRKFSSFAWRWCALMDLLHSGALPDTFIRRGDDEVGIHDNVLELAASLPLTTRGHFRKRSFLAALKRKQA
jgi:hypothetical protein